MKKKKAMKELIKEYEAVKKDKGRWEVRCFEEDDGEVVVIEKEGVNRNEKKDKHYGLLKRKRRGYREKG